MTHALVSFRGRFTRNQYFARVEYVGSGKLRVSGDGVEYVGKGCKPLKKMAKYFNKIEKRERNLLNDDSYWGGFA